MKTSSKIILENIRIDKQLRINVALVNDKQLNTLFNDIFYVGYASKNNTSSLF